MSNTAAPPADAPPPPAPPEESGPSLLKDQASPLLTCFTHFLTVALHNLLYHRNLYPATTFLTARAFNLAVHQSRHPGVCNWVLSATAATASQLQIGAVKRVVFVVYGLEPRRAVVERWVFDVERFPEWGEEEEEEGVDEMSARNAAGQDDDDEDDGTKEESDVEEESDIDEEGDIEDESDVDDDAVNWTDINEAMRGALQRLASRAEGLTPLPKGCTFSLALELRDDAPAPIGHPQPWIPSLPNLQPPTKTRRNQGSSLRGKRTLTVGSVRAEPLFFECWVEQGATPAALVAAAASSKAKTLTPSKLQTVKSSSSKKPSATSSASTSAPKLANKVTSKSLS